MGTALDFLVLGHVTQDLQPDGTYRLGGTVLYAAVTAARLGYRVGLLTAGRETVDLTPLYQAAPGVHVVCQAAQASTTFVNRYVGSLRQQLLLDWAAPLSPAALPADWQTVPIVLLGPVAQEVPPAWAERFPHATVGACLQGWLRAWDTAGQVHFAPWTEAQRWLPGLAAAFLSREDLGGQQELAAAYATHCPLLLLTAGPQGATLFQHGHPEHVAPFPVQEVDPTGAGDVFATAMLLRLVEQATPAAAARFAAAAAALSIQGPGISAIPARATVETLLQGGPC
jgi:1D-myo-inositol 3-kinase